MDVITLKGQLRHAVQRRLASIERTRLKDASVSARTLLERQQVWNCARRVMFYAPLPMELDVWPLFEDAVRSGKEAYLPRFIGDRDHTSLKRGINERAGHHYVACAVRDLERDLKTGQFGIRE